MKFILLISIYILSTLSSVNAQVEYSCEPSADSCNSYLCMEENTKCGAKGYYLAYAHKYCDRFSRHLNKFSFYGQMWLLDAKVCLQEKSMEIASAGLSCRNIKKQAFKSHVPCYLDAGFCSLSFKDKYRVMKVIYDSLLRPSTLIPGFAVLKKCYFEHKNSRKLHRKLLETEGIQEDFLR